MRWAVFAIFAFLALALEISLRNVLRLDSLYGVSPSFVACLATFVAIFAQRLTALWACWILGVFMDLLPRGDASHVFLIGPNALGYVFGGYILLLLRTMVFRRQLLTMGALGFVFVMASSIVTVMLLTVRHWYPETQALPVHYSGMRDLTFRALEALYTGVIAAVPVGWILLLSLPMWGFQSTTPRRIG
jgi:rod shape-determining protein MreD